MRKSSSFAVLTATLLAGCGGNAQQQPPAPSAPQVGYVTLTPQSVTLSTELAARTAAFETSEVRPQVNGLITARLFTEGDEVRAGQPLYRIDSQPYQAQVASARAALSRAKAAIASNDALARRYGELVKINAIAKQDYENAITTAQQARADVSAQEAALRTATIDLGRTTVRAPISGRIGRSAVTTGGLATASQTTALSTIQRLDPIYIDITQSSAALLKLRQQLLAGQLSRGAGAARVRLKLEDGTTYPIDGVVKFADVTVDPATGSQTIRAQFANPNRLLLPGMYVTAQFIEGTQANALLVPQRAVSRDEKGNPVVMIVGPGDKVQPRTLTAPRTIGDNWLVTAGLKAGDRIIVEGAQNLQPGTPVKPVRWQAKAAKPDAAAAAAKGQ
ncbi:MULTISPECIES: efflux RND transporter periplasmic adaptor subunit [unclassified Sphingomonas]|uniref:efflux RND transporter periplasmic adaptor subunit n=1 Tax=unclassified Sphingomonas TaxID=196159 RepID=UPI00028A4083|nr:MULTISPECIES: efflux RND transporter periplasmic adaptor subunit [unclassified Sphingomonas]